MLYMYKCANARLPLVLNELYEKNNKVHTFEKDLFRNDNGQKELNIY